MIARLAAGFRTLGRFVGRPVDDGFWEPRFNKLSDYNSEVARGLVHTPEWKQRMAQMQADYNAKIQRMYHTPNRVISRTEES